jgi:lysophospholipase L1-like esterase
MIKLIIKLILTLFLISLNSCISRQIPIPKERLEVGIFISKLSNRKIPYYLYLPDSYYSDQSTKFPIVLFLHGKGEKGKDLNLLKNQGLPKNIQNGTNYPFALIAPQLSEEETEWYQDELIELLSKISTQYPIDINRIYGTGLSLGGNGIWKLGIKYPEVFAALLPISAWGDISEICKLHSTEVWAFHGLKDSLVQVSSTTDIMDRLMLCNKNAKTTIYPDLNHDAWTKTYSNREVIDWMLSKKLIKNDKLENNKKKISKSKPLKLLIIGDSVAISYNWGITEFVEKNYHIKLKNLSKVSTGLTNKSFFDWEINLEKALNYEKFDLGVVLIGSNDPQGIVENKKLYKFPTPEWKEIYSQRILNINEIFKKHQIPVFWVLLPPMGPKKFHMETQILNQLYIENSKLGNFKILSLQESLGNEKGDYTKFKIINNKKINLRADDDIHMTGAGARIMSNELIKYIYNHFEFIY